MGRVRPSSFRLARPTVFLYQLYICWGRVQRTETGYARTHLAESRFSFVDPLEIRGETEPNEKFAGAVECKFLSVAPDVAPRPRLESADVAPEKYELFFRVHLGQPGFAYPGIPFHRLDHFNGSLTPATRISCLFR